MLKKFILIIIVIILLIAAIQLIPINNVTGFDQDNEDEETNEMINTQSEIEDLLNRVDESILSYYLEKFVSFGFKMTGSENADRAARWIREEFVNIGLTTYFDEWKFPQYKDKNVIGIHYGKDPTSDAVIVISAHYDTIGDSPGAVDDGSGIATMLTIANITRRIDFNHTIRFIAVSGEEVGTFGSFADAKKAYEKNENIIAVLNIDMIGHAEKSDEHIIQIFSPYRSEWIVDFAREIAQKHTSNFQIINQHTMHYPADHECYNDFGYDGIQFVQPKPEDAHYFHSPEDTLDKITYPYLVNVTKLILSIAYELADKPIDVQVQIIRPKEGYIYFLDRPILKLPCYNLVMSRLRAITYLFGRTTVELEITTDEEINSVYFGIDGYIRHGVKEPPYEWKMGTEMLKFFRLIGFHRITVCVTTNTGKIAQDEMDIFIVKLI